MWEHLWLACVGLIFLCLRAVFSMDAYLPLSSVNVGHYCLDRRCGCSCSDQRLPWIFNKASFFALFVTSLSGAGSAPELLEYKRQGFFLSCVSNCSAT